MHHALEPVPEPLVPGEGKLGTAMAAGPNDGAYRGK